MKATAILFVLILLVSLLFIFGTAPDLNFGVAYPHIVLNGSCYTYEGQTDVIPETFSCIGKVRYTAVGQAEMEGNVRGKIFANDAVPHLLYLLPTRKAKLFADPPEYEIYRLNEEWGSTESAEDPIRSDEETVSAEAPALYEEETVSAEDPTLYEEKTVSLPEEMPVTYTEEWLECTELYRQALDALPDALSLNWCPYGSVSLLDLDFNGIPELLLYDPSFDFVTICTVENGAVCRFNTTPVLNEAQLPSPPSANAIELEMGSICLNRPLEEQDMKNWNTPDIRPIVQYTDTETGEPVYLSISWDRAEAPAGYDPISYYTSTTTVMRFYCRDGLLAAETLASWSHIGSIDDLHFYTPITDQAVQSAEFSEINARYIPIPGIDYGRAVRDAALEDHLPTAGFLSPTPAVETDSGMPEAYIPENTAD